MRLFRTVAAASIPLLLASSGCAGYRLVRPSDIQVPDYEPRPVSIPVTCDSLVERAASGWLGQMPETEQRQVTFCQQQQIRRAQEEEAAARRLEAHAQVANLALRVTVVTIGAIVAVLAWAF